MKIPFQSCLLIATTFYAGAACAQTTFISVAQCKRALEKAEAKYSLLDATWDDCAAGVRHYQLAPNCARSGPERNALILKYAHKGMR